MPTDALWLAALLHDIGKVIEVAQPSTPLPSQWRATARYDHEAFSAYFVQHHASRFTSDLQATLQMTLKHHDATLRDEIVVQLADWLASYEREEAEGDQLAGKGKAHTRLCSILTRLERQPAPQPIYHPLRPLEITHNALFPQQNVPTSPTDYEQLWEHLLEELQRVPHPHPRTLQALLHKYLWTVPSDRSFQIVPDVSLYSHLVSAAAIAICLINWSEPELNQLRDALKLLFQEGRADTLTATQLQVLQKPVALLVKGDISGTQDFLYLLSSRGAARGLRGRSFYLQLLTETIAWWILRQLNLPFTSRLYVGGGHFYLLIPFESNDEWQQLKPQIAQKMWDAHEADLSLNLAEVEVCAADFLSKAQGGTGFARKWDEVSAAVQLAKTRRWSQMGESAMLERLFTPRAEGTTAEEMCQVCHGKWTLGVDGTDRGVRKCRRCAAFEDLGKQLRAPEYVLHFLIPDKPLPAHPTWRDILRSFGVEVHILARNAQPQPPADAKEAILERVDNTSFLDDDTLQIAGRWEVPTGFDWRLLADATPLVDEHSDTVADFDHLAASAKGVPWLGVLRMDVDDLGELFRNGLGDRATLSRIATLSESLRLFFEAWVPFSCRQQNTQWQSANGSGKVYLLYAGGDDLFLVGAWSALPCIAETIRNDFRRYAGGDHVTLSAGIAIAHEKYPLYRLAYEAKEALDDRAKHHICPHGRRKDSICFLQEPLCWKDFESVRGWHEQLVQMLKAPADQRVPRSLLQRLAEISLLYRTNAAQVQQQLVAGKISPQKAEELIAHNRWRWRMMYHLSRFIQRYGSQQQNLQALLHAMQQQNLITNIHVATRWAELLTREG